MGQARANTILQRLNYVAISAKAAGCAATEEPSERSLPFDVCTPFHSPKRAVYVLNERHQKREEKGLGDEERWKKSPDLISNSLLLFLHEQGGPGITLARAQIKGAIIKGEIALMMKKLAV